MDSISNYEPPAHTSLRRWITRGTLGRRGDHMCMVSTPHFIITTSRCTQTNATSRSSLRAHSSERRNTHYYEFKPRKSAQQERNVDLVMVTCSRLKHKNIPDLCLRHYIWADEILTRLAGVFSASRGLGETSLVHGWMNYGSMSCASKRSAFSFPGD